jgi:hypothetical protein
MFDRATSWPFMKTRQPLSRKTRRIMLPMDAGSGVTVSGIRPRAVLPDAHSFF